MEVGKVSCNIYIFSFGKRQDQQYVSINLLVKNFEKIS